MNKNETDNKKTKDRAKWKKAGVIFLIVTLLFASFYWFSAKKPYMEAEERLPENREDYAFAAYQLTAENSLEQQLPSEGGLCGSWMKVSSGNAGRKTDLKLELLDENRNLLREKTIPLYKVSASDWYPFSFDKNIAVTTEKCFLRISLVHAEKDTAVFLYNKSKTGTAVMHEENGRQVITVSDGALLPYRAQFATLRIEKRFLLLLYLTTLIFSIGILVFHPSVSGCFLILAITQSLLFQVILPPSSAPDEHSHFATAYEKSNRLLHYHEDESGYLHLPARPQDAYVTEHFVRNYLNRTTYEYYDAIGQEKNVAEQEPVITVHFLESTGWLMHLPAILGITLARLLHLSGFGMLFLGRIFMGAAYIAMAYYGIRKMPFHKNILMLIASFPMCLHLANSYSYDSVLLGFSFLFIGEVFYLAFQKDRIRWYNYLFLLFSALVFSKIKVIYILLLGLCILIPLKKVLPASLMKKDKKVLWGSVAALTGVAVTAAAVLLVWLAPRVMGFYYTSSGSENFSFRQIFTAFPDFIWRSLNTLRFESSWYWVTAVGARLGWLDVVIPDALAWLGILLVLLAGCHVKNETSVSLKTWHRGWMLGTAAAILLAMLAVSMCWSTLYRQSFWGMQGRYLLPAVPVLMIALCEQKWITLRKNIDHILITMMGSINVLTLIHAYLVTASR